MSTQSNNNAGTHQSLSGQSDSAFPMTEFQQTPSQSVQPDSSMMSSTGQDMDDGLGTVAEFEDVGVPSLYDPRLQRVILPEDATRAMVMGQCGRQIPQNEFGMPSYFYRSDMLPHNLGTLTQGELEACIVELDYSEGYPTYNNGRIFWQQLPFEPLQDFLLFQRYLDQAEELGLRQLQLLAMDNRVALEKVADLAAEYFWGARAKAYDYFQVAAESKRRILKARKVENKHFAMAEGLMDAVMSKFDDPDWLKSLSPKEALDVLQDLVKIQRLSLGLSLNGSTNASVHSGDGRAAASGADLMRDLTRGSTEGDGVSLGDTLKDLLRDPNFTFQAQALIFKVQGANGLDVDAGQMSSITEALNA